MFRVLKGVDNEIFNAVDIEINGEKVAVEKCRVSAMPFNRVFPGYQRPIDQTEESGFLRIVADEPLNFVISGQIAPKRAVVRPLSKNVEIARDGKTLKFTVVEYGKYSLEIGDEHTSVAIFVCRPRDFQEYGTPTKYFGAGVHDAGKITLKSGDRVFIDENAVVKGTFFGENLSDVIIYGYGVMDGGNEERTSPDCYGKITNGCIKFYNCENVISDGFTAVDSAIWVVNFFACKNVKLNDVKIVGQWKYNCDGIDVVNSSNVEISDCFIRAFDDVITLKGILPYRDRSVSDITVKNCVLWCGWGRTLEIGLETLAEKYENITFENCDLIHNSAVALDVQSGDYAKISGVKFKDLRVEYQTSALPEIYQNSDDEKYGGYGKPYSPILIKISTWEYYLGEDFGDYDKELKIVRQNRAAVIDDIIFENITIYLEDGCLTPETIIDVKYPHRLGRVSFKNVITIKS